MSLTEARDFASDDPGDVLADGIEALVRAGRRPMGELADSLFDIAHRDGDLTAAATVMELRCAGLVARMLAGTRHPERARRVEELLAQLGDVDELIAAAEEDSA